MDMQEAAERWDVSVDDVETTPRAQLGYGVRDDGTECVLKLRPAGREARLEIAALRAFDGHGGVRVLAADEPGGAVLLERVRPAADLRALPDAEATRAVARLMQRLHGAEILPDAGFPTLADWAEGFRRSGLDHALVLHGEDVFRDLLESSGDAVLLHGDLHHANVLRSIGGPAPWLAVDPQGVLGEREFEVAAFVRNPYPAPLDPTIRQRTGHRLDLLAHELEADRERLHGWSFAQTVLSACWTYEDGGDPFEELRIAAAIGAPEPA